MTAEQCLAAHPELRTRCTVWTRVMGYHRPTDTFNLGKVGEHRARRLFMECPYKEPSDDQ